MKVEKCPFAQRQVKYLGYVVFAAGNQPDHTKTVVVSKYPVPRNVKELRQFLGLSNYYHRLIANNSKVAEPLHKLLAKSKSFHWDSKCQDAFNELKHRLVNPSFPDFTMQYVLHADASDSTIGAILSQTQDGRECVIGYWSRQLQKAEKPRLHDTLIRIQSRFNPDQHVV